MTNDNSFQDYAWKTPVPKALDGFLGSVDDQMKSLRQADQQGIEAQVGSMIPKIMTASSQVLATIVKMLEKESGLGEVECLILARDLAPYYNQLMDLDESFEYASKIDKGEVSVAVEMNYPIASRFYAAAVESWNAHNTKRVWSNFKENHGCRPDEFLEAFRAAMSRYLDRKNKST